MIQRKVFALAIAAAVATNFCFVDLVFAGDQQNPPFWRLRILRRVGSPRHSQDRKRTR